MDSPGPRDHVGHGPGGSGQGAHGSEVTVRDDPRAPPWGLSRQPWTRILLPLRHRHRHRLLPWFRLRHCRLSLLGTRALFLLGLAPQTHRVQSNAVGFVLLDGHLPSSRSGAQWVHGGVALLVECALNAGAPVGFAQIARKLHARRPDLLHALNLALPIDGGLCGYRDGFE